MLDEIEKFMIQTDTSINFRTINLGGRCLYIEGIKSVISFGTEEMDFQMKKFMLIVKGENLKIKYLDKDTCVIEGKIISVGEK